VLAGLVLSQVLSHSPEKLAERGADDRQLFRA